MRKYLLLLSAACFLSAAAFGQGRDCFAEIKQDPNKAGTVFYMYNHDDIPAFAKPPRGYKAFYISHYGRHGARNHTSEADFDAMKRLMDTASERGKLTARGKDLKARFDKIYPILHGCASDLCDRGFEQQYKIAHNMYRNYPRLFRGKAKIDAVSTTVPRCILTMSAFTDQMLRENPGLTIYKQASNSTMSYLNPFSLYNKDVKPTDEGYNNKSAYWQKDFQALCKRLLTPEKVFAPLLTDLSLLDEVWDPLHLERAFYAITASLQCNGLVNDNLWEFIPYEEQCMLHECYNFRFYASKGADTLYQKGRQWAFVWTTMQDFIDKADEDLATGNYAARLRFGHDIIVMSLLALLDIDGYNIPAGSIEDVKNVFRAYDFPMSLNVQFVFYKNRAGDVLMRMMYNERDMALPIADCGTPYYYRWDDLRAFALKRIDVAHSIIASTQAPPKLK
ncbi:MAG: hypothetical protein J6O51_01510 [Bacteroidales bacterium]|nr:hypothetical protein [Bacteroidales bacterium]